MQDEKPEPDPGLQDAIYWYTLELRLPPEETLKRFASPEACRARLAEVRWPAGAVCSRCGSPDVFELSTRAVFKCRSCKNQFSVTSGTPLHGSRIELPLWFVATEKIIRSRSRGPKGYSVPSHDLADLLGIYYEAAWRLKKTVLNDLAPDGPGLLRESLCLNHVVLPATIPPNSENHFDWLLDELQRAPWKAGEPSG